LSKQPPSNAHVERKAFRLGYLFFFTSGAAALIYEIVWLRLLTNVFGNTTFAISAVLTAYMAGLGLGSFWVGRLVDRWKRPLFLYGCFEIGIGVYAALTLPLLKGIQILYVAFAQQFDPDPASFAFMRLLLSFGVMFIPTFFMGATLPILAKFYIRRAEAIGSGTALLYGINTAGAVVGTLLAGFFLLEILGIRSTLAVAIILNVGIGMLACLVSQELKMAGLETVPVKKTEPATRQISPPIPASHGWVRWLPAGLVISGATAMMYEVTWTRALAAVFGSSTYAFTVMLSTFLLGLSLGSTAYERILKRRPVRLSDWGWLQITLALSALITLSYFDRIGIVSVRLFSVTIGSFFWLEVLRFLLCGALMIVPTFCFGALFPVSIALYTKNTAVLGRSIGTLYLANTCGNILGSLASGFLLIPAIGIHQTMLMAVGVGGVVGLAVALADLSRSVRFRLVTGLVGLLLLTGIWVKRGGWDPHLMTGGLHVRPFPMVQMDSTNILASLFDRRILFYREGSSSIVSIGEYAGNRYLTVNGKVDASTNPPDMSTQVLSAHLPHLLHPDPRRTLVVGFGSGTTVSRSLIYPIVQLDSVEIEPAVMEAARYFHQINYGDYQNPKVRHILNDARNHLLIERGRYDIIISEPSNPWMAGVANLFTVEFYRLVQEHLNPGGILCQWLQAYTFDPRDFKMVIASVQNIFEHTSIWQTNAGDFLIMASDDPIVLRLRKINEQIAQLPQLKKDLAEFEIHGASGLLPYFTLGEKDVRSYVKGAQLNTDDLLQLEFSAPRALYTSADDLIRRTIKKHRTQTQPQIPESDQDLLEAPDQLVHMGESYLFKNKFAEAEESFRKALAADPNFVAAQVGLGRSLMVQGDWPNAIPLLEKAASRTPPSGEAKGYLGIAYLRTGEPRKGLENLEVATRLSEDRWEFLFEAGQALEKLERWSEAAEAYRRAFTLESRIITFKIRYAHCLTESGQPEQAARFLEELRSESLTHAPIYPELRYAYEKMDALPLAVAAYESLVQANPYRYQYWAALAQLYARTGDEEAAVRAIRRGQKLYRYFTQFLMSLPATPGAPGREEEPVDSSGLHSTAVNLNGS